MVSNELAPLEAHVETQVQHLKAVADVARELRSAEEQYARDYAELPFDLPAAVKAKLKRLPQLQGVSESFSLFISKCSLGKAAVVYDLTKEVIAPLEVFTDDHIKKVHHLLSELYELLQKETAFNLAYENLREGCIEDEVSREGSASEQQLHRMHRDRLLRKRDAERLAIQQRITALHFAGQRYEAYMGNIVRQVRVVYERMVAALAGLISELQVQLGKCTGDPNMDSDFSCEESWESFMAGYDCHIAVTCWMSELFKHLIPVEHKASKSLQKTVKLNRALSKAFGGVEFSSQFSGLIGFHGLLTVNIENPIMRTLKFTRARQERIRNELSKSLADTLTLVLAARVRLVRLDAGMPEKVEEQTPLRCNSLTSSETSECKVSVENTPELIQLETLERKLSLQRHEMAHVLNQTSFLAVKTMELMVQDYLKHVIKALATLSETFHVEPQEVGRNASPQPWEHIAERLSIAVSDQPALPPQDKENRRRCSDKNTAVRRGRVAHRNSFHGKELSAVQATLSFLQSAVGVVYWSGEVIFKTAKAHMPQSFQERAVLVAIGMVMLVLVNVCVKSSQLQTSWRDLTATQQSNLAHITHIVKLSLELCAQQIGTTTTST
ncbi:Urease accessory protein [Phytophthora megakarya]|uniref:Urease accessory protein n=1 Tax=Phytophthora megakarya TaxID=4795 RepID=A0A225WNV3_9STRA|nr:Urease accessory protein [Phytophthora megakarya]